MFNMKKVLGYISVILGFVLVAIPKIPTVFSKLSFLPKFILGYLVYIGIGLIVLGIIFISFLKEPIKSKQAVEVPIYKGKQIVGYRRA